MIDILLNILFTIGIIVLIIGLISLGILIIIMIFNLIKDTIHDN